MKRVLLGLTIATFAVNGCASDDADRAPLAMDDGTGTGATVGVTTGTGGTTEGGGGDPQVETTAQSLARQQLENGWGPSLCAALPGGVETGLLDEQQVPSDLTFKDCEGNDFNLAELCGADAVWLFFGHAWCPSCRSTGDRAEMIHEGFAGQNVASVQIVVEAADGAPADEELCQRWRDDFGHRNVLTLFDPNNHHTPLVEGGYTALNVVLDQSQVITPKFHSSNSSAIEAAIQVAIDR